MAEAAVGEGEVTLGVVEPSRVASPENGFAVSYQDGVSSCGNRLEFAVEVDRAMA